MLMMTQWIAEKLPKFWEQWWLEKNAICHLHYFYGGWDWYVLEYNEQERLFFGIVIGDDIEYWHFPLSDFEEMNKRAWYSKIERDMYWESKKVWEIDKLKEFLSELRDD
jgi:hypothetical protein